MVNQSNGGPVAVCQRPAGGTSNASSTTTASAAIGGDNNTGSDASNGHSISFDCHMWRMRREEGQEGQPVPQKSNSACTVMYCSVSAPWAVGRNSATRRGSGMAGHITRNPIPELKKPEPIPEKCEPEKPDHYFG